jgi:hypothetical protein
MIEGWKELTWASGANSIARNPSASFLSVSAPAFSKAIAVSPCPSAIAWCKGICPATSAAFIGLLFFSNSSTIGTEPTAAARWIAYWPRLSFTRAEAGCLELRRRRAMSTFFLEEAKWRAVWPLKSGDELTGASLLRGGKGVRPWDRERTCGVDVGFFPKEEINQVLTIFAAYGHHQRSPA